MLSSPVLGCCFVAIAIAWPSGRTRSDSLAGSVRRYAPSSLDAITVLNPQDLLANSNASANGTNNLAYDPACWPLPQPPEPELRITNPADCGVAVGHMISGGRALEPTLWREGASWTHESCVIFLIPSGGLFRQDTFTRIDIARDVARIQLSCVNAAHGFRGGSVPIGPKQVFDVALFGRALVGQMWEAGAVNGTEVAKRGSEG
ncbi:hypothetical protein MMC28_004038 [Mycoblastus sanguinarius]|nr:hypothetical protein [Mycoblastus sanguinarius]